MWWGKGREDLPTTGPITIFPGGGRRNLAWLIRRGADFASVGVAIGLFQ